MSASTASLSSPPLKRTRLANGALCVMLLAACAALIGRTVERRRVASETARHLGVASEQSVLLATLGVVGDDTDSSAVVAEVLLEEGGSPQAAVRRVNGARRLALNGMTDRPGSARLRVLLARSVPGREGNGSELWQRPLELAEAAAPGLDGPPQELAVRYLTIWPALTGEQRGRATAAIHRAFRSPLFVTDEFSEALFALGPDGAVALLPGDRAVLAAALEVAIAKGSSRGSELLQSRLKQLGPPPAAR